MNRLYIHGVGTLSLGLDEPFVQGTGELASVPYKEYVKPTVGRRFGRLSKITYVASKRAIAHAGVSDPANLVLVSSTCIGETKSSISLAEQIHRTRGALVSPSLIPNSVHNAAAGYLSIGIKDRSPSITVSQGWLSPEACISAAADMLNLEGAEQALVVCGDEADPNWVEKLVEAGADSLASQLQAEQYQEGAVAFVVSKQPCERTLGNMEAAVERCEPKAKQIADLLKKYDVKIGQKTQIRVRLNAGGRALQKEVAKALDCALDDVILDGPGPGTAQVAALIAVVRAIFDEKVSDLLLIGSEMDELAFLHWSR